MRLTERQKEITDIVRENGPITGEQIAERLHVTRSALRGDLAVLLSGEIIAARRRLGYYYLGGGNYGNTEMYCSRVHVKTGSCTGNRQCI